MTTTADTTATEIHVTIGRASTVHIAATLDGKPYGARCAWFGSSGPRKAVRRTTAPLTCKTCIKSTTTTTDK
jgi:hypothetical protein